MKCMRISVVFLMSIFFCAALYAAFPKDDGPDSINMKKNVTFSHKQHSKDYKVEGKAIDCKVCHHKGDEKKCSGCHDGTEKGGNLKMKDASHKQCQGCHKKVKDESKAPVKCDGCHPKAAK